MFLLSLSVSLSLYTCMQGHTHAPIQNDKQSHLSGLMPTETFIKMKRRNRKETSGAIYFPVIVIKLLCHSLETTQESLCSTAMKNAKASDFSRKKKFPLWFCFLPLQKIPHTGFPPKVRELLRHTPSSTWTAHGQKLKSGLVCAPRSPGFITHLQSLFVSLASLCLPCWVPTTWHKPSMGHCSSVYGRIWEPDEKGSPQGNPRAEPAGRKENYARSFIENNFAPG